MTLSDPTSGAGYAFGEQLTSAHMTTIATQQPDALDIVNGGTYAMGTVTLNTGTLNVGSATLDINASGTFTSAFGATITHSAEVTLNENLNFNGANAVAEWRVDTTTLASATADENFGDSADVWIMTTELTQNVTYTIDNSANVGARVRLVRRASTPGAFTITIQRTDTTALATMDSGQVSWVDFINTAANTWSVCGWSGNVSSIH